MRIVITLIRSSRNLNTSMHLTGSCIETFQYYDIYSCSSSCSLLRYPCPTCHALSSSTQVKPLYQSPSSTTSNITTCIRGIPREALRRPISFFIKAVRHKLLYDICKKSAGEGKCVLRMKDGFIWSLFNDNSKWMDGWNQYGSSRFVFLCFNLELSRLLQ